MPIILDASVGGAAANSYVTLPEAALLALSRPNASWWGDAEPEQRPAMLVAAARFMQSFRWPGSRVTAGQALAFPRENLLRVDDPTGGFYPTNAIPQAAKEVQVDLALAFLGPYAYELWGGEPDAQVILKKVDILETRWAEKEPGPRGLARYPFLLKSLEELLGPDWFGVRRIVRV